MLRTLPALTLLLATCLLGAARPGPAAARGAGDPAAARPRPTLGDAAESLLAALPEAEREAVLSGERVGGLEAVRSTAGEGLTYQAVDLGLLPQAPRVVRGLLAATGDYPSWVPLSPDYKALRVTSAHSIDCDVGKPASRRARETIRYEVDSEGDLTTWAPSARGRDLAENATLSWEVLPLAGDPRSSLVVHRRILTLTGVGRLSRSLDASDAEGRSRFQRQANEHARRLHWAMEAALSHPPGSDREALYLDRHASDFGGSLPYWAR